MYLALEAAIVGQAALLSQPVLLLYATASPWWSWPLCALAEEPTLARTFGAEYERYRCNVPGWWPRLQPWPGKGGRRLEPGSTDG